MLVTGGLEVEFVNHACALDAVLTTKPCPSDLVRAFVRRAAARVAPATMSLTPSATTDDGAAVGDRVRIWAARYRLSTAGTDVLRHAVRGQVRGEIAADRGTSLHTVKNQIADILRRTGDDTLQAAVSRLLREVVRT